MISFICHAVQNTHAVKDWCEFLKLIARKSQEKWVLLELLIRGRFLRNFSTKNVHETMIKMYGMQQQSWSARNPYGTQNYEKDVLNPPVS